jgi:polyhydroxybutyrate depolymerase
MVMVLHGHGGNAEHTAKNFGWIEEAEKENFIVVFPESASLHPQVPAHYLHNPLTWHHPGAGQIGYIKALIEHVQKTCAVDAKRVYCTGFSSGAWMSFNVGIQLSDKIAAIGPVCGCNTQIRGLKMSHPVSMMLVVGGADAIMPVNGGEGRVNPWSQKTVYKEPVVRAVEAWLELIHVSKDTRRVDRQDGAEIIHYGPGDQGQEVVYVIVEGNGHEWPGVKQVLPVEHVGINVDTFKTTSRLWQFFKSAL